MMHMLSRIPSSMCQHLMLLLAGLRLHNHKKIALCCNRPVPLLAAVQTFELHEVPHDLLRTVAHDALAYLTLNVNSCHLRFQPMKTTGKRSALHVKMSIIPARFRKGTKSSGRHVAHPDMVVSFEQDLKHLSIVQMPFLLFPSVSESNF